jgi:DNA-binding FadR family transcriptional regulator
LARYKNLHGQVVDELGRQIVSGTVLPGASLPTEPNLSEQFGVSRVVIREAIKSLAAKGMVVVGPSIGTRVLPPDQWRLLDPDVLAWHASGELNAKVVADLIELRRIIEPQAARLAAQRAQPADLAAIRKAYRDMAGAVAGQGDYVVADTAFHTAVLTASHNQFLCQLQGALAQILSLSFSLSAQHPNAASSSLPFHESLLICIEANDADGAAAIVETMIGRNDHHLQKMIAELSAHTAAKAS